LLTPRTDHARHRLYSIWALSTLFVVSFTCIWVTPAKRIYYVLLFLVIEVVSLAVLIASARLDEMPRLLQIWVPLLTVICAGAPTLAFDKHNPEAEETAQDSAGNRDMTSA
jgi:hypothetical protein